MSKKTVAIAAFVKASASPASSNWSRKDWIAHLSHKAKISNACASTYLSNINSGKWSVDTEVPTVDAVEARVQEISTAYDIDKIMLMTSKELVEHFNLFSPKPVAKFRDRATGIKRTLAVCGLSGA